MMPRTGGKAWICLTPVLLLALAACEKSPVDGAGSDASTVALTAISMAGDAIAGKTVFKACANCHQIGPSARGGFGPQLNGIVGRPAGSTSDFRYSAAMKNAGFAWTEDKLRAFLRDPDAIVPRNKMRFFGIHSEHEMNDLLAYLRSVS